MEFTDLPKDLKNVISAFAYGCKWEIVEKDLKMCETVKNMEISWCFTRDVMWSHKYMEYIPSPLICFEPIQNFTGSWSDYFEWHSVQEFLWRLDFRRRFVKLMYSRREWRLLFKKDWKNILMLDAFYRFLLYTRIPCFKPLWEPCGFNAIKSFRSPTVSARWWLEDEFGRRH